MKRSIYLMTPLLIASAFSNAALSSPCSEQIEALSKSVKTESREAISASTSGKGEAAARESQGQTGSTGTTPTATPPEKAAQAGEGAEKAQQANVALNEARIALDKGDEAGCMKALARAQENLNTAP